MALARIRVEHNDAAGQDLENILRPYQSKHLENLNIFAIILLPFAVIYIYRLLEYLE